jgi:hypothetical protein
MNLNGKSVIPEAILACHHENGDGEGGLSELQYQRLHHELEIPSVLRGKPIIIHTISDDLAKPNIATTELLR